MLQPYRSADEFGEPGTRAIIYYWDQNGPWTYSIDGAAAITVTPGATFTIEKITVSGLANTTHTIALTSTVLGVGVVVAGFEVVGANGA